MRPVGGWFERTPGGSIFRVSMCLAAFGDYVGSVMWILDRSKETLKDVARLLSQLITIVGFLCLMTVSDGTQYVVLEKKTSISSKTVDIY